MRRMRIGMMIMTMKMIMTTCHDDGDGGDDDDDDDDHDTRQGTLRHLTPTKRPFAQTPQAPQAPQTRQTSPSTTKSASMVATTSGSELYNRATHERPSCTASHICERTARIGSRPPSRPQNPNGAQRRKWSQSALWGSPRSWLASLSWERRPK